MSDRISVERLVQVLQGQAKVANTLERHQAGNSPEVHINLRSHASTIRSTLQSICEDLDLDVRGVNLPWSECGDCGGEDGDHGDGCPADKLAVMGKNW